MTSLEKGSALFDAIECYTRSQINSKGDESLPRQSFTTHQGSQLFAIASSTSSRNELYGLLK
jgi:hypothetical protein